MRPDYLDWVASSVVTAIPCNIIVFLNKLSVRRGNTSIVFEITFERSKKRNKDSYFLQCGWRGGARLLPRNARA